MKAPGLLPLIFAGFSSSASAAQEAPYLGAWDCGVAIFWFTPHGYDNGSSILPIRHIEMNRGVYTLKFDGGYRIALFDVTPTTLSWYSPKSGDTFQCSRAGN